MQAAKCRIWAIYHQGNVKPLHHSLLIDTIGTRRMIDSREHYMASSPIAQGQVFIGPGLSRFKMIVTLLGVFGVVALVLWIAIHQGASALGSTIVAILFIIGFLIYLRIVAPVPFTITLEPEALVKRSQNGEVIEVRWEDIMRVKEEFFPNGTRISVTVYLRVPWPELT